MNLQPRTAEMLELRGLLDDAEERSFATVEDGHSAMTPVVYDVVTLDSLPAGDSAGEVGDFLKERLATQGTKVLRGHEVVDFVQDKDFVSVRCRTEVGEPTGETTVKSLIPLGEPGLYRFIYGDRASSPADMRSAVSRDEVRRMLRDLYCAATVSEILWASRFSDAARLATHYRDGRVPHGRLRPLDDDTGPNQPWPSVAAVVHRPGGYACRLASTAHAIAKVPRSRR